jgi:hypothetical protein
MSAKCPICGAPTVERYRPFCSKRCADVDLHRWLSGGYAVPASSPLSEFEDEDDWREPSERLTDRSDGGTGS